MIDRKYFPSNNFLYALAIAIVIVLLTILLNYWKPSTTKYINNDLASATDTVPAFINIDSDKDGLPDWKEGLYGTDPKKTDTDGDGTSDFDEISLNRDPLKANTTSNGEPNDKIDLAIIEENKKALEEYERLNEIEKFSRNLMSNIIASQPVGGTMDQSSQDLVISKAMGEIPNRAYSGITKSTDLNLLKTDNTNLNKNMTDYVRSYSMETGKLPNIIGADLNAINSFIDGSATAKTEILKFIDKYQAIVNNLIKMPVPVAIGYYDINYHLSVINDLEIIIAIEKDIVNSGPDSLGLFSNLTLYNDTTQTLLSNLSVIDGVLNIQR